MKRSAFTLVETMTALFVTALALLTIQMDYQWVNNNQQQRNAEQLDWYGLLGIIESGNYRFALDHIAGDEAFVQSSMDDNKAYIIRFRPNKQEIILTTAAGGYVPLMQNITACKFTEKAQHLNIKMTTTTNQQFEGTTIVGEKK